MWRDGLKTTSRKGRHWRNHHRELMEEKNNESIQKEKPEMPRGELPHWLVPSPPTAFFWIFRTRSTSLLHMWEAHVWLIIPFYCLAESTPNQFTQNLPNSELLVAANLFGSSNNLKYLFLFISSQWFACARRLWPFAAMIIDPFRFSRRPSEM